MLKELKKKVTTVPVAVAEEPLIRFFYGVVHSGKTAKLLESNLDYDRNVVFVLPEINTNGTISADRIKISDTYTLDSTIFPDVIFGKHHQEQSAELLDLLYKGCHRVDKVVVDEAQFLTVDDAYGLVQACKDTETKLDCYGLLTDFRGEMFRSARELVDGADEVICVERPCEFIKCREKANWNCLIKQAKTPESNIVFGEDYIALCDEHREVFAGEGLIE